MSNGINIFDTLHIDILKEIANIGSGNAVTELAQMLHKKIDMTVPNVNVVDFKDIAHSLGGAENLIIATLVNISGDINGMMMFVVLTESANTLLVNLGKGIDTTNSSANSIDHLTDENLSSIKEIGRVLTSAYLNALAMLTNQTITPSEPSLAIDMANAILSVPAIEFGKMADYVLFIESIFEAENDSVSGYFLLLPDMLSFDKIFRSIGAI